VLRFFVYRKRSDRFTASEATASQRAKASALQRAKRALYRERKRALCPSLGVALLTTIVSAAGAQQPDVSVSPFVTFLPTGSASPMTGLALTLARGPFALRAGGHISLQDRSPASVPPPPTTGTPPSNPTTTTTTTTTTTATSAVRPWGADLDALAFFESYKYGQYVAFTPYVFAGVSTSAVDTASYRFSRQGWSYGGGLTMPVGSAFGLLGEARWRMSRFVMPNAPDAPVATREFRFGVSFHVGAGHPVGPAVHVISSDDAELSLDGGSSVPNYGAMRVLSTADEYVGTPYRRGGTSPNGGFDASGFVRFVFGRLGVNLPRTSREQARVGNRIQPDWRAIAPGDLVMFEDGGGINHVAIYVGRSRIIHSSASGGGVRYDDLETERGQWFVDHLVAVRRVTPDLRGVLLDLARGFSNDGGNNADVPDHAPRAAMRRRP